MHAHVTPTGAISRRHFIAQALMVSSTTVAHLAAPRLSLAAESWRPPIVVFSKIFQELNLNYDEAAALTAEAGLDGIDCPVRPQGEVLPERVKEDLPRYVEALRKHNLRMPLLTTAITGLKSPHAEEILRIGRKLGVEYYRLGFVYRKADASPDAQVEDLRAQLKDLAALNGQLGLGALWQNHSPSGKTVYLGGNLAEMSALLEGFEPARVGAAFDIGHAVLVHGDDWRRYFEKLKAHLKVAYVKDAQRGGRWVPFGQGELGSTGYFKLLKEMGYRAPLSLHVEFDWSDGGRAKNRAMLLKALKESRAVLEQWLAGA